MRIAENCDVSLGIYDIETLKELFDIGIFNPDTGEWIEYEISKNKNDLYEIVKFYTANEFDYWVSYNGINFDHQVLQFILENYGEWYDLSGLDITGRIYEFVQRTIDDQNYDIQPPYKESEFPVKCIDVFRIHHFDNEARRTSLKWCAFMMNMDVEEMPVNHGKIGITDEDIRIVKAYRRNDVIVTKKLLDITLGIVDIPELMDYEGKNKIQDRFDLEKETGMKCLNWSDVKIGEEWNRLDYIRAMGDEGGYLYPSKPKYPFGQRFKKFFPASAVYSTDVVDNFRLELGEEYILNKKQEFPIKIGNTTYTVAKGGIHSTEKHRRVIPPQGWSLRDADVQGQYPNAVRKWRTYPPHLQEDVLDACVLEKIERRKKYKNIATSLEKQGKEAEARPYTSIQSMLKLALNGGLYGKLGQKGSFLECPEAAMKITIGCQMEILLLIEMLTSKGIEVISGNTDGVVCLLPLEKEEAYKQVCKEWEERVGNTDLGKLEFTEFQGLWQESVNSYIGKKADGSVKKKGRFVTIYGSGGCEMNKNKSKRIIALALEEYFINGSNPIDFITNHKNIFDFCIAKKAFGKLHYEEIIDEEAVIKHKKLIRYYVSTNGHVFMKRGLNNEGQPMNNHCEALDVDYSWMGQPLLKYFNKVELEDNFQNYNVDYKYYILETLKRIDSIEHTKKAKLYADTFKTEQFSLF